jgi:hypothetical protein
MIGCEVGAEEPASGSTVMAKVFASTPAGSGGLMTVALPLAAGLKTPAGIGAPFAGTTPNLNHVVLNIDVSQPAIWCR